MSRGGQVLTTRNTGEFSLLGVTWDDPRAQLGGTAEIRVRDAKSGVWSPWRALDTDVRTPEAGPDHEGPGLRAGTQPLWVGPSDGVQARVTGTKLPKGLRVDLVDPEGGTALARTAALGTATAAGAPVITSRAQWGADKSLVADPPTYTTDTTAVFVHHTAGTNDYTCAESASLIRGILTYHVKSNGWNDIGYNFFVDKGGTLFEGRAGGHVNGSGAMAGCVSVPRATMEDHHGLDPAGSTSTHRHRLTPATPTTAPLRGLTHQCAGKQRRDDANESAQTYR
ncbi:hypothetical protein [Streptomyces sp. NPDC059460]|uniref:hypothetical protein n=1 Tax=Streptomyces sp. NPDC059460 TaxID=3346840 RepID=UPI00368F9A76